MKRNDCSQLGGRSVTLLLVAVAILPLTLANCSKKSTPPVALPRDHVGWGEYKSQAIVIALPSDETELILKHEAIPYFVSIEGELVGMQAMEMPFPLGEGVSLDGIQVDSIVKFTFEVDWNPSYFITSITVLPAETELDFSDREPPTVYHTGP